MLLLPEELLSIRHCPYPKIPDMLPQAGILCNVTGALLHKAQPNSRWLSGDAVAGLLTVPRVALWG